MIHLKPAADILGNFSYGVQFRKTDILGYGEAEGLGNFTEGLHLLDRINTQIRFQIQIRFQHILGITGLLGDQGSDVINNVRTAAGTRLWCLDSCTGVRLCRGIRRLNTTADVLGNFAYGIQFRKTDIFGHGQAEGLGDFTEGLYLLDRVNAQIRFQIKVRFQHIQGVTGLLGDQGGDLLDDVRAAAGTRLWYLDSCTGVRLCRGIRRLNTAADVLGNFAYGIQLRKADIFGYGEAERLGDFTEGLHLLDRVNAQIRFQIQIRFQHITGVSGLVCDQVGDLT